MTSSSAPQPQQPVVGRLGRYAVLCRWASGGMADIYAARQIGAQGFDKLVALKVLRSDIAEDQEFRDMFFAEARTAALLTHPHIVQTFDAGEAGQQVYIAMEFVQGEPLGRCARVLRKQGPFPQALAVQIAADMAGALHYAHTLCDLGGNALHLVHRDVSPSNIMLTHQGGVKLLDFGIAKVANQASATRVGVLKGKLAYMSPEQASGGQLDARSDVFSLGTVLWGLLTGKRAFRGETDRQVIMAVFKANVPPPSKAGATCNEKLDAIVLKALARSPADRYGSAHEIFQALSEHQRVTNPDFQAQPLIREVMQTHFGERAKRLQDIISASDLSANEIQAIRNQQEMADLQVMPGRATGESGEYSAVSGRLTPPTGSLAGQVMVTGTPHSGTYGTPMSGQVAAPTPWTKIIIALVLVLALGGGAAAFLMRGGQRTLVVASTPPGALVLVNGQQVGTAPVNLRVEADRAVNVSVEKRGYTTIQRALAPGSDDATINAELVPADVTGTLIVESEPGGATVAIDGEDTGLRTPAVVPGVWVGAPHRVAVTLAGHAPAVEEVDFGAQSSKTIRVRLSPASGAFLAARCAPAACQLYVNGRRIGNTPIERHEVPAGQEVAVELRRGTNILESESWTLGAGDLREISHGDAPRMALAAAATDMGRGDRHRPNTARRRGHMRQRGGMMTEGTMVETAPVPAPVAAPEPVAVVPPPRPAPAPEARPAPRRPDPPPRPETKRTLTPRARVGSPRVRGAIDRTALRSAVRSRQAATQRCYAQAYASGAFEGSLTVHFVITASGRARNVRVAGQAASRVAACVTRVFASQSYPRSTASDADVEVNVRMRTR